MHQRVCYNHIDTLVLCVNKIIRAFVAIFFQASAKSTRII